MELPFRLPAPKPPPYDPLLWQALPWPERLRLACQAWAADGYGAPLAIYGLYLIKVGLYVAAWTGWCSINAEPGLWTGDAFCKAIVWSLLFESLGLGCASGPLTGRYLPPVAAPWHFLRPGTIRMPLLPGVPGLGGDRRRWLEVLLYAAHVASALRILAAPVVTPELVLPTVVVVAVLGVLDKTFFLACRAEHYWAMCVCFSLAPPGRWVAGCMAIQLAIWLWAAVSKLTHHFPSVICVMTSNSPVLRWRRLREAMYRSFPDDLRPSRLAVWAAHAGTAVELAVPLLLVAGEGGPLTVAGLGLMVVFHAYITSNFPMAVPIEWNVAVVYGGLYLFTAHPGVSPLQAPAGPPLLTAFLAVSLIGVPLLGNLRPAWVSFLMAMRYYAGNWAYSIWLFRGASADRIDRGVIKLSDRPEAQLARLYEEREIVGMMGKVPAFRAMHLHGRALQELLPRAVDDVEAYSWVDGEFVAGMVLGYNFGDGHLHDHRLLASIQARCGFEPGELRHVYVESQPLHDPRLRWRIHDAATGLIDEGHIAVRALLPLQPWPL